MSLFEELKRRNVFRVGIAYAISAWILLQVVDLVLENIESPEWVMQVFMLAVAIGFPLVGSFCMLARLGRLKLATVFGVLLVVARIVDKKATHFLQKTTHNSNT